MGSMGWVIVRDVSSGYRAVFGGTEAWGGVCRFVNTMGSFGAGCPNAALVGTQKVTPTYCAFYPTVLVPVRCTGTRAPSEPEYYPRLFQQSVTLTAKMWHGGNGTGLTGEDWRWSGWRLPPEYAPLLIGFCCGIAVVLLAISAVIVWRCILIPNRKKDHCGNVYEEVTPHSGTNGSIPISRDSAVFALRNGQWGYQSRLVDRSSTIYRSATVGAMPMHHCTCEDASSQRKSIRPNSQSLADDAEGQALLHHIISRFPLAQDECRYADDDDESLSGKERSKSTPALEDLYAKVNFSKKRKNRMRKDEAAIIALSKSRSGHDGNSMALGDSAVVVYNERTAL